jgi:outer membrane protein
VSGFPAAAYAQPPITLDAAVQTALAHNASLRAARAGVEEAAERTVEARSGFFPRVSVAESWQRGNQPVFVFSSLLSARQFAASDFALDALNHPDPTGFFRASVGVEQLLFDGGRLRAMGDAAVRRRDMATASVDEAAAGLAVQTAQTFARIVSADAAARAAEAGMAAAREDLARAERRRDAGMLSDADVLALVVHVADLEQRSIQAAGEAAVARAELNRLMGAPVEAGVRIVDPEAPGETVGTPGDLAALIAEADAARPEVKRAAAGVEAAEAARRQARAGLVPQVAVQAVFDVSGTTFNDRASAWIVGGELRWTFSTGGGELAAVRSSAQSVARARAEADEARAAVHVDVVSAVRRLETARARHAAGRAAASQARESQRIVRDRFEAGLAPVNDVLRASSAVLDADANSVAALVDTLVATAMLQRSLGRTP